MNYEAIGAMIARAVGVVLITIGVSTLIFYLPWLQPQETVTAGWTSYSPLATHINSSSLHLHDSYFLVAGGLNPCLPALFQVAIGVLLLLLSKPVGRMLARGLNKPNGNGTTEADKTAG